MATIMRLLKYMVSYLERVKQTAVAGENKSACCVVECQFPAFNMFIYLWASRKKVLAPAGHWATAVILNALRLAEEEGGTVGQHIKDAWGPVRSV